MEMAGGAALQQSSKPDARFGLDRAPCGTGISE
jgi:hypothetical protein